MDAGKVDIYALRSEEAVGEAPQFADPLVVSHLTRDSRGYGKSWMTGTRSGNCVINSPGALPRTSGSLILSCPRVGA